MSELPQYDVHTLEVFAFYKYWPSLVGCRLLSCLALTLGAGLIRPGER